MRLVRIERVVWDMLAIQDRRGRSVWDVLREDGSRHAQNMRALILHTARDGPPRDSQKCTPLRDGILEFRRGPKRGPKLRVFWFYDEGKRIICTHSVWKREAVPEEIDRAVKFKKTYESTKERGRLTILKLNNGRGPGS